MNTNFPNRVTTTTGFSAVAIPRPGIGLSEAQDKWLAAGNAAVIDDGGRGDPRLLVAREESKTVLYELVPELMPPGFTVEQAMAGMRAAGYDVRGLGPRRGNAHTVVVIETRKF